MRFLLATCILLVTISSYGRQSRPLEIGVVDELNSKELSEKRVLNIYFPEGYDKNDTVKYPVIYLLDGSMDEDFLHVAGLIQFNSFSWINRIPGSILVGIATVDRRRDFTFPSTVTDERERFKTTGHSDRFIAFIEKELQPFIEQKYKGSSARTLIGQSLGGLLATEILLKKPTLFDQYIIVSPSLWWSDGALLNYTITALEKQIRTPTGIYFGVGKEGATPTTKPRVMEEDVKQLAAKISAAKNPLIKVYFDYLPQEDHATSMHQAVFNAIRLLFPPPVKHD